MQAPRICAVVLGWNNQEELLACLDSLQPCLSTSDALIYVDNASIDGSVEAVRSRYPEITIIANETNLGFSGGNNRGIHHAMELGFEYVLLLNNDARIDMQSLEQLHRHLQEFQRVAAAQPLLVRMNAPDQVDSAGHELTLRCAARDTCAGAIASDLGAKPRPIFGACAAAVLLRCSALRETGLFDELLFIIFEDVDLMFRLRTAGWEVDLVPSARALHHRGISGAGDHSMVAGGARLRRFWNLRNGLAIAIRYAPLGRLIASSPRLFLRAAEAMYHSIFLPKQKVLPIWWAFYRRRAVSRRSMRQHHVDRFYPSYRKS